MSNFPDFEPYGYQVIDKLGMNTQAGRITYKAVNINNEDLVVIKQFGFVSSRDWEEYQAVEREIKVLQGLNHPGIPRYLDSFDPGDGICLVQEYKDAQNLAIAQKFHPKTVKNIALQILEILVYLQGRIPIIIHRDLKPENILVDEELNVYLVDFGLAKIGDGEVTALSSMVAGTPGFIAPEQLLNQPLTTASDLYGLGITIICLLTGTKSQEINNLIDSSFRIDLKPLVSKLTEEFIVWLEKLVTPNVNERYPDAFTALGDLKTLDVIRFPGVELSHSMLEFIGGKWGEKLTKKITVSNFVPETVLVGIWEVAPHKSDGAHNSDNHPWIAFKPAMFSSNKVACEITVDTSKLMVHEVYERQILLRTNSSPEIYGLYVKVKINSLPIEKRKLAYFPLAGVLFATGMLAWVSGVAVAIIVGFTLFVSLICGLGGAVTGGKKATFTGAGFGALVGAVAGAVTGALASGVWAVILLLCVGLIATKIGLSKFIRGGFSRRFAMVILGLTAVCGFFVGIGLTVGFFHPLIILALLGTGLPLARLLIYPSLNKAFIQGKYRRLWQGGNLIQP